MKRISLTELIEEVSEMTETPVHNTRAVTEAVFERIKHHMLEGNSVLIWRFGVFLMKERKATRSHNVCLKHVVEKPETQYPKLDFSRKFMKK